MWIKLDLGELLCLICALEKGSSSVLMSQTQGLQTAAEFHLSNAEVVPAEVMLSLWTLVAGVFPVDIYLSDGKGLHQVCISIQSAVFKYFLDAAQG